MNAKIIVHFGQLEYSLRHHCKNVCNNKWGRKEINLHKKTRTRKTSNRNQKKKREERCLQGEKIEMNN